MHSMLVREFRKVLAEVYTGDVLEQKIAPGWEKRFPNPDASVSFDEVTTWLAKVLDSPRTLQP